MMSQVIVASVANCDVVTIYRCWEPRTIVACHMLKKNLNENNGDTLVDYAVFKKSQTFPTLHRLFKCKVEWNGVANFYTPLHSNIFLTDSGSEILQHSAPKYSETKIRFDEKFEPIVILLNSLG